jgi:hypothetical protein
MNKRIVMAFAAACAVIVPAVGADKETDRDGLLAAAAAANTEAEAKAVISRAEKTAPSSVPLITGVTRHNLAVENPARWAAAAVESLEKCAKTGDPVAIGYLGSAVTLKADLLSKEGNMMGAAVALDEGFRKMDEAVLAAPGSVILRFLRAENSVSVSENSPFARWDVAEADVAVIEKSGALLPAEDRARIQTIRGRIALGKGDAAAAMRCFEAAIRTAPSSHSAVTARKIMEDFEE